MSIAIVANKRGAMVRAASNKRGSVSANIILIGTPLTALSRNPLQLLLSLRIRIANLQREILGTERHALKMLNNLVANIARLESESIIRYLRSSISSRALLTGRSRHHGSHE